MQPDVCSRGRKQSCPQHLGNEEVQNFQKWTGSLNFLAIQTRPDIRYATHRLSMKFQQPSIQNVKLTKHVLRHLKGTAEIKLKLHLNGPMKICPFTDSNFGTHHRGTCIGGWIVLLGEAPILWNSRKQSLIPLSTTEAEYLTLVEGLRDALWIKNMLVEMGFQIPEIECNQDN